MTDHPQYGSYPDPDAPARSDGAAFTNPTPEPAPKKKRNVGLIVGVVLVVAGLAVGGYYALSQSGINAPTPAAATATTTATTKLQAAAEACSSQQRPEDLGHTLTLDNVEADEDPGPDGWVTAKCIFGELDMPSRVEEHIGQTRALDGTQTDSWDGMNARWNYHPDHGMNITFYDK